MEKFSISSTFPLIKLSLKMAHTCVRDSHQCIRRSSHRTCWMQWPWYSKQQVHVFSCWTRLSTASTLSTYLFTNMGGRHEMNDTLLVVGVCARAWEYCQSTADACYDVTWHRHCAPPSWVLEEFYGRAAVNILMAAALKQVIDVLLSFFCNLQPRCLGHSLFLDLGS